MRIFFRTPLTEAVVVNPDDVDRYVATFTKQTQPVEGKNWFERKLRSHIFNTPALLTQIKSGGTNVELPAFAQTALARDEPIFAFRSAAQAVARLSAEMQHVVDWFNALGMVAAQKPTNPVEQDDNVRAKRELASLPRVPMAQITAQADNWFRHMGTRVKPKDAGVEGMEVILRWPDGYYAGKYTDIEVMRQDGNDLQNCLRFGTYAEAVMNGEQTVIGLRKPNNEAVVGIRIDNRSNSLAEVKGRNNQPVMPQYHPYVIDLIPKLKLKNSNCHDLRAAGIFEKNGKFGSFKDVAELVFDQGGIKVWATDTQFHARYQAIPINGGIIGGRVSNIEVEGDDEREEDDLNPVRIAVLNALATPPTPQLVNDLIHLGVFFNEGRYGNAKDVGTLFGRMNRYEFYRTPTRAFVYDGSVADASVVIEDNRLIGSHGLGDIDDDAAVQMLNLLKLKPGDRFEKNGLVNDGIFFNGVRYGRLEDVGVLEFPKKQNTEVYRLGKRPLWVFRSAHGHDSFFTPRETKDTNTLNSLQVRLLTEKYKFKYLANGENFGVWNSPLGAIGSATRLIGLLPQLESPETPEPLRGPGNVPWRIPLQLFQALRHLRFEMTAMQKKRLLAFFRPKPGGTLTDGRGLAYVEQTKAPTQVFDLVVHHYTLYLPYAADLFCKLIEIETPDAVKADATKAAKLLLDFVEQHPAIYEFGNMSLAKSRADPMVDGVMRRADDVTVALEKTIAERRNNPDKYATDLSSRFAALNAFRRLGR